jgi:hypothetical protein
LMGGILVAGRQGFEPRTTDPESVVIPFHHLPVLWWLLI